MKNIYTYCVFLCILIPFSGCMKKPDQSDLTIHSFGGCSFSVPISWIISQSTDTKISFWPKTDLCLGDHCRLDIISTSASQYDSSDGPSGIPCNVHDEFMLLKQIYNFNVIIREGEGKTLAGDEYHFIISHSGALDSMVQEDGKKGEDGFEQGTPIFKYFGLVNKKNVSIKIILRGPREKEPELHSVATSVIRTIEF